MHEKTISSTHQSSNHLPANPAPPIVRTLEEGDYLPDWRAQTVEKYLTEIAQAKDKAAKATELALAETDEFVRRLLHFHCGLACEGKPAIEYAISCLRRPESAWAVKAMVVAGRSVQQIAEEMATLPGNIECFEQLYFDARPYLEPRFWLKNICCGEGGHRWLEVALKRGWPGVEEVVLRRLPHGPRNLSPAVSIAVGRVQDYFFGQEASNIAPSEKDLELLGRMLRTHDKLPFLQDSLPEKEPLPESAAFNSFKKLPFASRDKIRYFLRQETEGPAWKAALKADQADSATSATGQETAAPTE